MYKVKILQKEWFWVFGIVIICILSRLPLLLSPFLKIDEDECTIGLMALHAAQGKELPFYFLGQSYGFAWVETLTTALAFKIFGVGILSLKNSNVSALDYRVLFLLPCNCLLD